MNWSKTRLNVYGGLDHVPKSWSLLVTFFGRITVLRCRKRGNSGRGFVGVARLLESVASTYDGITL